MADLFGNEIKEDNGANFSEDGNYRYSLWRIWDKGLPLVMYIGLNPSTANQDKNDNTITKLIKVSKNNGYGGFYMTNCFAYVSTDPKLLKRNPMSDEWNNDTLSVTAYKCKNVVFAWGNFDVVKETGRDKELIEMFPNALCLFQNKNGSPKHPLYCKDDTQLIKFEKTINKVTN